MKGRHVVRGVGETEQGSEFSSTRLDSFDEASMQSIVRCHSDLYRFSTEVDMDDEGVPSTSLFDRLWPIPFWPS